MVKQQGQSMISGALKFNFERWKERRVKQIICEIFFNLFIDKLKKMFSFKR